MSRQHELHSMWNSWSWRILRPVRNLVRQAQGLGMEVEPRVQSPEEAGRAIDAIRQSLSWRITAPLRAVHSALFMPRNNLPRTVPQTAPLPVELVRPVQPVQKDSLDWPALRPLIDQQAARFSVASDIHVADFMFRFMMSHEKFAENPGAAVEYYFEDGARSMRQTFELLEKYGKLKQGKPRVLEFASGYGMVTRHFVRNQSIALESCDIHPAAIQFINERLGVCAVSSSHHPETTQFPHLYDFIFVLSFFSHMPITTWTRWLVRLTQALEMGGILAFTTHGMASRAQHGNPEIGPLGFWFVATSEQSDLSTEEYGSAVVTETFVRKVIASIPSVELVEMRLGYWFGHQDLYVVQKIHPPTSS